MDAKSEDKTSKVFQREKIGVSLNIGKVEWTPKQRELLDLIHNPKVKILLIKGPAGSSKTFCALFSALELLNSGRVKEIILVRSIVESSSSPMGFLPGDTESKLQPFLAPFEDKFSELLSPSQLKYLKEDNRLIPVPVGHLRGRQFSAAFVLADEVQNFLSEEIQTLLTRIGKYSKTICCADVAQVDYIKGKKIESGFEKFYNWYESKKELAEEQGIFVFQFGIADIVREEIIKFLVEQYDEMRRVSSELDYSPSKKY